MRLTRLSATTVLAGIVLAAPPSAAQVKLEVTPFFTSFYATNFLTFTNGDNLEKQSAGPGFGAALTWRFNNMWAVEGQVVYVVTDVQVKNSGFVNFQPPTEGHLLLVNGRMIFQPRRSNLYFALGAGTVTRSGPSWDIPGLDFRQNVAGIVGFGVRARVSPTWGFKIGAEVHFYESDPDGKSAYYQSRLQHDVLVTIGVPFSLIGR